MILLAHVTRASTDSRPHSAPRPWMPSPTTTLTAAARLSPLARAARRTSTPSPRACVRLTAALARPRRDPQPLTVMAAARKTSSTTRRARGARGKTSAANDEAARYGLAGAEKGTTLTWLPTFLTLARVVAVPALAGVYYSDIPHAAVIAGVMFMLAAFTDWLDGYLARKLKASSAFGAFLDPVADKLMVAASLCLLCTRAPAGVAPWAVALPSIVIIGREITMSALREWCAAKGGEAHAAVKVNNLGKYKTATQMVALTVLLLVRDGSSWFANGAYNDALVNGGVYCLWVSAALALVSLWVYMSGVIGIMMASD